MSARVLSRRVGILHPDVWKSRKSRQISLAFPKLDQYSIPCTKARHMPQIGYRIRSSLCLPLTQAFLSAPGQIFCFTPDHLFVAISSLLILKQVCRFRNFRHRHVQYSYSLASCTHRVFSLLCHTLPRLRILLLGRCKPHSTIDSQKSESEEGKKEMEVETSFFVGCWLVGPVARTTDEARWRLTTARFDCALLRSFTIHLS